MEKINILSPAKINLSLDIISKREDNFHNIRSYVQIIDFFDEISIEIDNNDSNISLDCSEKKISTNENLAYIAANKFLEAFNIDSGLKIKIKKKIPLGSGMGGGSSNAAAVLIGLSKIFKIEDFQKILNLGEELGSDIPLFLYSRSACISQKGQVVNLVKNPPKLNYFIVMPRLEISSKKSYRNWKVNEEYINNFHKRSKYKKIYFDDNTIEIKNDFYPLIIKNYSEFYEIIHFLNSSELESFSITGSGSAIFSIIDNNVNVDELKSYIESSNKFRVSINSSIEGWRFQID